MPRVSAALHPARFLSLPVLSCSNDKHLLSLFIPGESLNNETESNRTQCRDSGVHHHGDYAEYEQRRSSVRLRRDPARHLPTNTEMLDTGRKKVLRLLRLQQLHRQQQLLNLSPKLVQFSSFLLLDLGSHFGLGSGKAGRLVRGGGRCEVGRLYKERRIQINQTEPASPRRHEAKVGVEEQNSAGLIHRTWWIPNI